MSWPRYPLYKESGVGWVGEVPEHWSMIPLKKAIDFQEGPGIMAEDFCDAGVPLLRVGNVSSEFVNLFECNYLDPNKVQLRWDHFRLSKGDLLISASASMGTVSIVTYEADGAIAYTGIIRIREVPGISNREFLKHFVVSCPYETQIDTLKSGSTIQHYGPSHLKQMFMICPPIIEQVKIANFLNREIAKIDTLIAEQRNLVERLKEKRQAAVSRLVTIGTNQDAPMKPSGVEWYPEVPRHWEVIRLKNLVREGVAGPYGSSLTKAVYTDSGYRVYGQQQVIPGDFSVGDYYISENLFQEMRRYEVHPMDVLISVMGTVGKAACVPEGIDPGIINPRLVLYRTDQGKINPWYLTAFVNSYPAQTYLSLMAQGSTMDGLNMGTIEELRVPVPPLAEQENVLEAIKKEAGSIDGLISEAENCNAFLREHRYALIDAVVTGKVDVREVASV